MEMQQLNCPSCGNPIGKAVHLNQPFLCAACGSTLVLNDLVAADRVLCHQCRFINQDSNLTCGRCGAVLQDSCPFCFAANPLDSIHCRQCNVHLQQARLQKKVWLEEKRSHDRAALDSLEQAKQRQQQAEIERLVQELDEPENHPVALYCLQRIGSLAIEPLIEALRSEDVDARFGAARALGTIGEPAGIPALISSLSDPEPVVRYWALDALVALKGTDGIEAIRPLLQDEHKGVRERARQALRQLKAPQKEKRRRWWPF